MAFARTRNSHICSLIGYLQPQLRERLTIRCADVSRSPFVHSQFEIPTSDELRSFHQLTSEPLPDAPGGYFLRAAASREDIVLAVDPLGRSMRLRFSVLSQIVLDVFREGATTLRFTESSTISAHGFATCACNCVSF